MSAKLLFLKSVHYTNIIQKPIFLFVLALSVVASDDISTGAICPVSEDVIAVHNRTHIKFVFLRSGKSRLLVPKENQGVGVIGGRDDLAILAWSDIGPPAPKVHVYRYADPLNIITLEGKNFIYIYIFVFDKIR